MRKLSPFGLNPQEFFSAVLNLGPQRIDNPAGDGQLLVVAKIKNRPNTYVCLPDGSHVPVLVGFSVAVDQPLLMGQPNPYGQEPALELEQPRPLCIGDLIQRLAEYCIEHDVAVPTLAESAVNLWFNTGLMDRATAGEYLTALYHQYGLAAEWILDQLDAGHDDGDELRILTRLVEEIAQKMIHDYSYHD